MALPLSTPGGCCGHNLNMHSGNGLEGTCVVCSCVGFEPDRGQMDMATGIGRPDGEFRKRQCRAEYRGPAGEFRCSIIVTEATTHLEDHKAVIDETTGETFNWAESVAQYPVRAANPDRTQVGGPRDVQVGGDHYSKFKIQVWDIIDEYGLSYYEGQILKYLLRRKVNRVEDLKKARHVLDKAIELEEGGSGGA